MKKCSIITALLGTIVVLSACSFVSLDPQAKDVMVSSSDNELGKCKSLGTTNVSLWSKADSFQSQETVEEQLDTLARNQAAKMGGNAVTPDSVVNNGQRTYRVYNCADK